METSLQKLVRYHRRNVAARREELLGIERSLAAKLAEIASNRYISEADRELQSAGARNEAGRQIKAKVAAAEQAIEQARRFTAAELDKIEPGEPARSRVRRLIDRQVAPADIIERAQRLGDRETLAALRDEIRWGLSPGTPDFLGQLEQLIAAMTPDAGEEFGQLIDLTDSAGIKQAEKLVLAAALGGNVVQARMAYAYAKNGTPAGGPEDDDAGDEGGEPDA